jgi:hypothetical protein
MEKLLQELERRWTAMFAALVAGDDVPPAQRLRAEGMMEAAVLLEPGSVEKLDRAMDDSYQQAFGRAMAEDFGADWRDFYPFPQVPAMGRRAPVYPSTRE